MHPQFQFFGFEPDDELRRNAQRGLDELLNLAPYGASAAALLQKTEHGYRCAVSIYTQHGPFVAESTQDSAGGVLSHVVHWLTSMIRDWREERTHAIRNRPVPRVLETASA